MGGDSFCFSYKYERTSLRVSVSARVCVSIDIGSACHGFGPFGGGRNPLNFRNLTAVGWKRKEMDKGRKGRKEIFNCCNVLDNRPSAAYVCVIIQAMRLSTNWPLTIPRSSFVTCKSHL